PVGHHHGRRDRGGRLDDGEDVVDAHSAVERGLCRDLDRGTVHHRIAVRQADLHQSDPGLHHRADGVDRALDRRVAGGQIADERGTVLGPGAGEEVVDHAHCPSPASSNSPNQVAAVWTSLSPRPERLTKIVASGPSSSASMTAPASAWADSMAGMMPSVLQSRSNAAIAWASVAGRYSARPVSARWACSGPTPG